MNYIYCFDKIKYSKYFQVSVVKKVENRLFSL